MKLTQTNLLLRSFTWTFGTGKGFDNGLAGNSIIPVELKKGDWLFIAGEDYLQTVTSSVPGVNFLLKDAAGVTLANAFGNNAAGTYNVLTCLSIATQDGFMILNINGGNFITGQVRFDLYIIRQY